MKNRARAVVVAGGALAVGLVAGSSPTLAYGPTPGSLGCAIYFGDGSTPSSPTTWNDTFSLTQSPATPAPGQTVTVTFTAQTGSANGPVPLEAGMVPVTVKVALGGSQSGNVTLSHANYPSATVPAGGNLGTITATGTYVAGGAGAATATVNQVVMFNAQAATYCSATGTANPKGAPAATQIVEEFNVFGGSASVSSITGQTVTTHARVGNTINFSVSGLDANANLTANLQAVGGGGTPQGAGTGTTDAAGNGTGTLQVPTGATTGARSIVVSDGTNTVTAPITILGQPTLSITPNGGGTGTAVAVSGTNWNPGSTITVGGYQAFQGVPPPPATSDPSITATASASGGLSTTFTVNDPATKYIGAMSGAQFATANWAASSDDCVAKTGSATSGQCSLDYNLSQTINAGNLAMSRDAGAGNITFSAITLNGAEQETTGNLPAVTVTDFRGSTYGWSLTGTVTDFTGTPGGTISKDNLSWAPSCAATAGATNAVVAAAGSEGAVDGATLCSAPMETDGTGGSFDASAVLSLNVPAHQLAGSYSAKLTLTLS